LEFFSKKAALVNPKMVCVAMGEEVQIGSQHTMRPFITTHRVASNGYLIYAKEMQLKEQYRTLSGQEIGVRQAAGAELREMRLVPEIAYTGDTTFDCFLEPTNADILKAKILITEATYIDDRQSVQKAKDRGHMHLMEIAENAEMFRHVGALVLVHLSDRYNRKQVDYWIRTCLPVWLQNKTWVPTLAKDFE
jgi:ribonuclease Z